MGAKGISAFTGTIVGAKKIDENGVYPIIRTHYHDPEFAERYDRNEFDKRRAIELGIAAKLMERMCEQGAEDDEYGRLVLYSYLLLDAIKYDVDFAAAAIDLRIADLMEKY